MLPRSKDLKIINTLFVSCHLEVRGGVIHTYKDTGQFRLFFFLCVSFVLIICSFDRLVLQFFFRIENHYHSVNWLRRFVILH